MAPGYSFKKEDSKREKAQKYSPQDLMGTNFLVSIAPETKIELESLYKKRSLILIARLPSQGHYWKLICGWISYGKYLVFTNKFISNGPFQYRLIVFAKAHDLPKIILIDSPKQLRKHSAFPKI